MNTDDELTYGIDMGTPDGDMTALSIKQGKKVYSFVGEEAEVIIALLRKSSLQRVIDELQQLLLLTGHSALTRRNIHDRITALQAELQQVEKEQA